MSVGQSTANRFAARPRRRALAAGATAAFAALMLALLIYWTPALPYLDDDICITSQAAPRAEPASGSSDWSWLPIGVECQWLQEKNRVSHFEGPPPVLSWIALGLAGAAAGFVALGSVVSIHERTSAPFGPKSGPNVPRVRRREPGPDRQQADT
jgi:hypothetical protein